ncbi:MAG: GNAT family N-acetyltransferase [Thermoleophilia bacterium]|nr:GNAT family N-acetyltransferase [Thermoleophilia bacterium]
MTERPERRPHAREATPVDLVTAAAWVTTAAECQRWAGPDITFPVEQAALMREAEFGAGRDVALEDDAGVVAFGQVLPKEGGRMHLARVIVRPDARGRGVGRALVEALLARAGESGAALVTLNVYRDNTAAIGLYTDLGFRRSRRPGHDTSSSSSVPMELRIGRWRPEPAGGRSLTRPVGSRGPGARS